MNHMSKSITIHQLDPQVYSLVKQRSLEEGLSLNKVIKKLLHQALGLSETKKKADYSKFCGMWTDEEFKDFHASIKDLEKVDKELWR